MLALFSQLNLVKSGKLELFANIDPVEIKIIRIVCKVFLIKFFIFALGHFLY
jgi:hypothetical protein